MQQFKPRSHGPCFCDPCLCDALSSALPDSKEGCHFTFHRLSAKAFPRKPFRKPLPQGLHRKAFYELPHDKSAQTVSKNHCRKVYIGKLFMNYLTDKV
ncbi:hypothetical protein AVEN_1770-1 [Araneus ventricosus]|uniref:Uncharacterized protein n=1 Tax=Araneus ventricosus TaxID=182803 RepID=A0A4Y2KAG2_ARAVE|nr:hypothetical protein AVEN_1770-1 [Araneus ventricosus]